MNLASSLLLALLAGTPLLLAVLGEMLLESAGVINIGVEGMMLTGAICGVAAAQMSGSVTLGFLGAAIGAAAFSTIFGWLTISQKNDQIVAGAALNFIALGGSSLWYSATPEMFVSHVPQLPHFTIGSLSLDIVALLSWLLAPLLLFVLLRRTRIGLRLRASGEYPEAVRLTGGSVEALRWLALLIEGALCGVAGAYISLALSSGFAENMIAGRGFIALAIVIFGRWRASGALLGTLLFSLAIAFQYQLQAQSTGVQFHLLLMLPYAVTLLILFVFAGELRAPQALGK